MSGKKKYSNEFKLAIVLEYLEGKNGGFDALSAKYGVDRSQLRGWVHLYKNNGIEGLTKVTRTYDGATKIRIVEYMQTNSLSVRQTAALFGIPSSPTIAKWERIYYEEGKEALLEERRGRKRMSTNKPKEIKKKNVNEDEDLLAEVQRLRMENEYLKKLNALIQEREKLEQKKK